MAPTRFSKIAMLAAVSVPFLFHSGSLLAQDARPREPMIIVAGQGEASVAPDMAFLSLAVVRNAKTADAALSANSAAMKDVLASLRNAGVAERDIQTSNFSIQPQYRQTEPKNGAAPPPPEVVGYEVSNSVSVKVRDLAKLGSLIDASVKLGVNQGGQISFTNDKPDAVLADARKAAVANAVAKAKTLAEAAGVKLGRVLQINEDTPMAMPAPMMRMLVAKQMEDSVPVAGGENSYSVTVNVTFALEQ
ncbi:SIMPL domain-containing protein [Neorhizobium lilium]|uniref:SIMPL domain-containing protein n=1 Tax=Neorhizobium lilium TaxID=2503024 RepID=UPI003CCACEFB